ncbi:MAG: hypothetical protein EB120_13095 [Proteobacteria bacterium]|nr:hypothetical protein [Pseudomonadota bacterium]NDG28095.1 hypothetical protein [Pseudomonadota bacterium]
MNIQDAVSKRLEELKETEDFKTLKDRIKTFEIDPYCNGSDRQLDESGMLESVIELRLDAFSEEESEVIDEILRECSEFVYFSQNQYSQGKHEWRMSQCLGYPIIIQDVERRGDYVIYSHENKSLRFTSDQVKNERHGLLLIEKAMRDAGEFSNIVRVDRYGYVLEEVSTGFGTWTDAEVAKALEKEEKENEEE